MPRRETTADRGRALRLAAGVGALSGMRSMSGLLVVVASGGQEQTLGGPVLTAGVGALALCELVADKHPRMPARTELPSVLGRLAAGSLAGGVVASRERTSALAGALVGSVAAGLGTVVAYRARQRLAERCSGEGSVAPGLIEDGLVLAAGAALVRALRTRDDR